MSNAVSTEASATLATVDCLATATLEPEPTQHNSLDRLQTRKKISTTLLFLSAATLKPI